MSSDADKKYELFKLPIPILRVSLQILGGALALAAIILAFLTWRMSEGPISLNFIGPHLEQLFNVETSPTQITFDDLQASWTDWEPYIVFTGHNLSAIKSRGEVNAVAEVFSAKLSIPALLRRNIIFTKVDITGLDLQIVRPAAKSDPKLDSEFLFNEYVTSPLAQLAHTTSESISARIPNFPLPRIEELSVSKTQLTIFNASNLPVWEITSSEWNLKQSDQEIVVAIPSIINIGTREVSVSLQANYSQIKKIWKTELSFSDFVPSQFEYISKKFGGLVDLRTPLSGNLTTSFQTMSDINEIGFEIFCSEGLASFTDGSMFFGDYQIKNLHMLGHVVTENPSIFLENFVGTFNGSELYGSASLTNLYSNPHINAALDAHQIPIDRLPKIWPQNLAKSARTWVVENISGGTLEDITAYVDFSLSDLQKDNLERNQIFGQFRVRDTRVAYIKDLPTANNLFADGWFDGIDLHIGIEMGTILDQRIDGTTVEFLNVYTGEEIGLLGLRSTGPLSNLAAFPGFSASVIPWFEDGKTQGLAGSTSADLRINFPLISSLMVQDLTITGKVSVQHLAFQRNENMLGATKLSLSRGNGIIFFEDAKVSGNATAIVNKTPVEIEWATAPNSRPADLIGRAIIRTTVTDNSLIPLENLFRFATGKAGIEITINSLANGYQNAFVNIDASHLAASFPSIKFEKKLGETVHIISNLDLEGWKVFSPMTFHIRGENIEGAAIIELNADNEIAKLSLKDVSYDNERITADISFNNDIYEMNAHTKSLDVGSLQALEATSEQKIRKVRLLVDNLTAGKMTTFSNTKIQYNTLAEGSLEIKVESKDANLSQSLLNLLDDIQSTETLSDNRSFHMSGKIGTLYSSTGDILRRVQTEISAQDGQLVRTRIEGHFNEQEKVRVEMTGSGTERKIIIASENAGEFLHLLGVTSNLVGGKLYLEAQYESDSDKPTLVGQCIIENFHVTNTPIIAQLLSMSLPTNVFELLAGKGVPFAILNAPFRYEGSTLELLKARATGVSLGITVDGEIDLTSDSADIRGTIIPAYLLNNLVGTLPVIGDILTGPEKEGIFAAQYSAKGPTEDLEIFVNPLTVLAPGILRDLFNLFSPDNAQPVE